MVTTQFVYTFANAAFNKCLSNSDSYHLMKLSNQNLSLPSRKPEVKLEKSLIGISQRISPINLFVPFSYFPQQSSIACEQKERASSRSNDKSLYTRANLAARACLFFCPRRRRRRRAAYRTAPLYHCVHSSSRRRKSNGIALISENEFSLSLSLSLSRSRAIYTRHWRYFRQRASSLFHLSARVCAYMRSRRRRSSTQRTSSEGARYGRWVSGPTSDSAGDDGRARARDMRKNAKDCARRADDASD